MRIRVMLVSLTLLLTAGAIWSAGPSAAGPKPLRSGTIVGGTGLELGGGPPWQNPAAQRSGCEYSVDCLAWLASGCSAALAGQQLGGTTSVVDVGALADGRTPRTFSMTAPTIPPWGLWPGAVIQLWRQNCTEIRGAKQHTIGSDAKCSWSSGVGSCKAFRIPTGTRWMTVTGYVTTARLAWALT